MQKNKIIKQLIGLSLKEAEEIAALHGYTIRVVSINDTPTVCTRDVRLERINVAVDSNKFITETRGVG